MASTISAQVLLCGGNAEGAPNGSLLVAGTGLKITQPTNVGDPVSIDFVGGHPGQGTVTNVATGTGLTGGPITSTGTITLANTAVVVGSYTNASITVDQQGRITSASNGSVGSVTWVNINTAPSPITPEKNKGYYVNGGVAAIFTLPNNAAIGDTYTFAQTDANSNTGITIQANDQNLIFGDVVATSATGNPNKIGNLINITCYAITSDVGQFITTYVRGNYTVTY